MTGSQRACSVKKHIHSTAVYSVKSAVKRLQSRTVLVWKVSNLATNMDNSLCNAVDQICYSRGSLMAPSPLACSRHKCAEQSVGINRGTHTASKSESPVICNSNIMDTSAWSVNEQWTAQRTTCSQPHLQLLATTYLAWKRCRWLLHNFRQNVFMDFGATQSPLKYGGGLCGRFSNFLVLFLGGPIQVLWKERQRVDKNFYPMELLVLCISLNPSQKLVPWKDENRTLFLQFHTPECRGGSCNEGIQFILRPKINPPENHRYQLRICFHRWGHCRQHKNS